MSPSEQRESGPKIELLLGFRFGVYFYTTAKGEPLLDTRFQRIKGLSATVKTTPLGEGGQNLYVQKLPTGVEYDNLVLERGMVLRSRLNDEFGKAMSNFQFAPADVMVILFDDRKEPLSAWLFRRVYPVKWSTSDMNATEKNMLVDTLELAYAERQIVSE